MNEHRHKLTSIAVTAIVLMVFATYFILTIKYVVTRQEVSSSSVSPFVVVENHKTWINKDGFRIGY